MDASASVSAPLSPTFPSKGMNMETLSCKAESFSPGSDKRFWSHLRNRVDTLLENKPELDHKPSSGEEKEVGNGKRLSEDTALLLRGFDSVAYTLSKLSSNIDFALQGAKDLTKAPTITDIFQTNLKNLEAKQSLSEDESKDKEESSENGKKRKLANECPEEDLTKGEKGSTPNDKMLKKAKNLAVSMATKASFLAKELKSIKSDLCFMQKRCVILEEENEMLRHGYNKGIQPEEDDLVRLQLEALLAEKSRLANENANLTRENQCLRQVVEYHQATTQDLSATYEEVINGSCLDFSSPPSGKPEGARDENEEDCDTKQPSPNKAEYFEFSTSLNKCYDVDEHQFKRTLKYSP